MPSHFLRAGALPTLLAFACVANATPTPEAPPSPLDWTRCPTDLTGIWPELGSRLSCARAQVPVDHMDPRVGTIDLGIVRVRASKAVERKGAIFFNFGGPGGDPMESLPAMAADWLSADPDDELEAPRRRLFEHYDLVAVVPRGMRGGWVFDCMPPHSSSGYDFIPSGTDDANLRKVERKAGEAARKCTENPFYRYVNSEQNAHDMEFVRRALGESKLNYFGLSYGSWLGAWYAARYPQHVGRMVFDSSMNVASTFAESITRTLAAEDEALERRVLRPVAANSYLYGLGSDIGAMRQRIRQMRSWTRRALSPAIATPAQFVAAMKLDEWLRTETDASETAFQRRIARAVFSTDARTNLAVRKAATELLPKMFPAIPPPAYDMGSDGDSVHMATLCNDDSWESGFDHWAQVARTDAQRFPAASGELTYVGLFCSQWGTRTVRRPSLGILMDAPPFLIVQAEYDHSTPLSSAEDMRDTFPNAYLVIARNLEMHGIYGQTRTPCVERAVADFLLNGTLPENRTTSCVEEVRRDLPRPPPDALHEHTEFWRRVKW